MIAIASPIVILANGVIPFLVAQFLSYRQARVASATCGRRPRAGDTDLAIGIEAKRFALARARAVIKQDTTSKFLMSSQSQSS
jgi:hypothetical protein